MRYNLTPDTPRPMSRVHAGVAPGRDARWRGVVPAVGIHERQRLNSTRQHERERRLARA